MFPKNENVDFKRKKLQYLLNKMTVKSKLLKIKL